MKLWRLLAVLVIAAGLLGLGPAIAADGDPVRALTVFSTYLNFKNMAKHKYGSLPFVVSGRVVQVRKKGPNTIVELGDDARRGVFVEVSLPTRNGKLIGLDKLQKGKLAEISCICSGLYGPVQAKGLYVKAVR